MTMVEVTAAGDDARERYRAALARFTPFLEEGRSTPARARLPADTARFAIGGADLDDLRRDPRRSRAASWPDPPRPDLRRPDALPGAGGRETRCGGSPAGG